MRRSAIAMVGSLVFGSLFVVLPALAHQSDAGCTPKNHPTPVPEDAITVEQTGSQVWEEDDGTIYAHGSTGWASVNPNTGKAQINPSGERFTGTPLDNTPAEDVFDNSGYRIDPNGATKVCLEVNGTKVEI